MRERLEKSATEVDEDLQPIEPDELVRKEWCEAKEPPETLVLPILPYQKEGLGWMYNQVHDGGGRWMAAWHHADGRAFCVGLLQEHLDYHGGILADEMVSSASHGSGLSDRGGAPSC